MDWHDECTVIGSPKLSLLIVHFLIKIDHENEISLFLSHLDSMRTHSVYWVLVSTLKKVWELLLLRIYQLKVCLTDLSKWILSFMYQKLFTTETVYPFYWTNGPHSHWILIQLNSLFLLLLEQKMIRTKMIRTKWLEQSDFELLRKKNLLSDLRNSPSLCLLLKTGKTDSWWVHSVMNNARTNWVIFGWLIEMINLIGLNGDLLINKSHHL